MRIGCIGAGHIGQAVAKVALKAGHQAMLCNSRGPGSLRDIAAEIGCTVGTLEEAAAFGDMILIAIPLKNYPALPAAPFAGKIVLDTGNYYPQRDGHITALDDGSMTTSAILARQLPHAKVVKAFNAIFAADIVSDGRPQGAAERRALPIAGDDADAKAAAAALIDQMGFDVVDAGPLGEGWRFERARPAYCIPMHEARLKTTLAHTTRESLVPEGSWRR